MGLSATPRTTTSSPVLCRPRWVHGCPSVVDVFRPVMPQRCVHHPLHRAWHNPREWWRGCLVHLPRTIWIPGVLAPVALPALVKGAIVLGVTRCLTLWTNDRFVRSTAVGALLTGGATRARPPAAGSEPGHASRARVDDRTGHVGGRRRGRDRGDRPVRGAVHQK